MRGLKIFAAVLLAVLSSGCATTTFLPYESTGTPVQGSGGTKMVVEGMEVWSNGEPPRKFNVIGVIEDERPGGPLPMASLTKDVVAKARESGGDAIIKVSNQKQVTGYVTNGSATIHGSSNYARAYGSATTVPVSRNYSKFVVIKYVE